MSVVLAVAIALSTPLPAPVKGIASWYAYHPGQAAAGPSLRRALGSHWRGRYVNVWAGARHVRVRLTDWCLCPHGRVVDLDVHDFARLRSPRMGLVPVLVR